MKPTIHPRQVSCIWTQNTLPGFLSDYEPGYVFNADETGLFFKLLPNRTHTFKGDTDVIVESVPRRDLLFSLRVIWMELKKLPLLVIGKSKKPRCFEHINNRQLTIEPIEKPG